MTVISSTIVPPSGLGLDVLDAEVGRGEKLLSSSCLCPSLTDLGVALRIMLTEAEVDTQLAVP